MTTQDRFERRVAVLLREIAGEMTTNVDPLAVARRSAAGHARSTTLAPRRALLLVALVATLALAYAILATAARPRAPLPPPFGPARNGIIVTSIESSGLTAVDPATGEAVTLHRGYDVEPRFSNDGRRILFGVVAGEGLAVPFVMDTDGSHLRQLLPVGVGTQGEWAPDGRVVLVDKDGFLSIIDLDGSASARFDLGIDIIAVHWRPNRDQILIEGRDGGQAGWYLVNPDGTGLRRLGPAAGSSPILSPDGSTIAYSSEDAGGSSGRIHILGLDTGIDRLVALDVDGALGAGPESFSPDGTKLLIKLEVEGPHHGEVLRARSMHIGAAEFREAVIPVEGAGPPVVLGSEVHGAIGGGGGGGIFSPDGRWILSDYTQAPAGTWLFDVDTGRGDKPSWVPAGAWGMTWQRLAP